MILKKGDVIVLNCAYCQFKKGNTGRVIKYVRNNPYASIVIEENTFNFMLAGFRKATDDERKMYVLKLKLYFKNVIESLINA